MGRIIRFPIKIKTDFASELNFGVTPALYSSVRPISAASISEIPSEMADRIALQSLVVTFSGQNPTSGEAVYAGTSTNSANGVVTVDFISLSGQESIVIYDDVYYVNVGTNQPGIPNSVPYEVTKATVNGGILQESITVNYYSFNALTNAVDLMTLRSGMCIGKILIRCTLPFDTDATAFSIGIDSNVERFVLPFSAPIGNGPVDIVYGTSMEDKVEYVSSATANLAPLIDGTVMRMYRTGPVNQSGQIQVVIFYDQL